MTDPGSMRPLVQPPAIAAPAAFRDRRVAYRRAEDRQAHQEKVLLARSLDVLAASTTPESRLAGLLQLLAKTAGARRAAVLADGVERRSAVAVELGEDPAEAEALAGWLDATSTRSRAERAASGRASISLVVAPAGGPARRPAEYARDRARSTPENRPLADGFQPPAERASGPAGGPWYAIVPIPVAGNVVLGFEFGTPDGADRVAERLPPQLARHAAVALALVTEQLATERELAALRAAEAERTQFISTVAHELRTPLTGLRGYLELILGDQVDDPDVVREFLERSRGIVESMGELVGDLLELSKIESGTLALSIQPFSVAEASANVAGRLLPIALEREIRLDTSLPPKLRSATGDRRRVEQILTNLAANALKFAKAGGTVEIVGRFDGSVAIVVVRDDGPGISVDDRSRIFERFHRLAAHDRITGTGLGLPIARDLARKMAGDLGVASIPGAGSSFVLALPGPTPVEPATLAAAMNRAVTDEEISLEERAVLRSLGWSTPTRHGDLAGDSAGHRRSTRPDPRSAPIALHAARAGDPAPA